MVHLIEWKQSGSLIINKQISVSVCPQLEALSDAISVWRRRGAGAARWRRRRRRPEGGWLWQRRVAVFAAAPWWSLLNLPLRPYHRLSGHQDQAGLPGAGEHQYQEEAEDLWDQGEEFFTPNVKHYSKLRLAQLFLTLLVSDRKTAVLERMRLMCFFLFYLLKVAQKGRLLSTHLPFYWSSEIVHKKDERGSFHALWLVGFDPWLAGEWTLTWKEGIILWYMAQKPIFFSFKWY